MGSGRRRTLSLLAGPLNWFTRSLHLVAHPVGDAMPTQKTACQRIEQFGGKYLFFFKDNHPTAHEDLALFFEDPDADQSTWGVYSQTDKGHGRLTTRLVRTTTEMKEWFAGQWAGVAQTFQVIRTVRRKQRKLIEQAEAGEQTRVSEQGKPSQPEAQVKPPTKAKQTKKAKQVTFVEETRKLSRLWLLQFDACSGEPRGHCHLLARPLGQ